MSKNGSGADGPFRRLGQRLAIDHAIHLLGRQESGPGTANQLRPSSNSLLPLAEMPSQLSRAEEVEGEWVLEF